VSPESAWTWRRKSSGVENQSLEKGLMVAGEGKGGGGRKKGRSGMVRSASKGGEAEKGTGAARVAVKKFQIIRKTGKGKKGGRGRGRKAAHQLEITENLTARHRIQLLHDEGKGVLHLRLKDIDLLSQGVIKRKIGEEEGVLIHKRGGGKKKTKIHPRENRRS